MRWTRIAFAILALACAAMARAQDAKTWLESQGLEAVDAKSFEGFDVVVAHPKGAKDGAEQVVVLHEGKVAWQPGAKESPPGTRWTIHAVGVDLDGDGQPDVHLSAFSGTNNCCTTHHILRLRPQVRPIATYSSGAVAGGEFIRVPGRKEAVMVSADGVSANAFAPFASSYFPLVVLQITRGRLQMAQDLMQTKLPGQPPPICGVAGTSANLWLKERCAEYTGARRQARTAEIKSKLAAIKSGRTVDQLKWEDYYANGVLAGLGAEMNRYFYTGHGNAGYNWLEGVWPGNDAIKLRFIQTLRQTEAKSAFAEDLKRISLDNR